MKKLIIYVILCSGCDNIRPFATVTTPTSQFKYVHTFNYGSDCIWMDDEHGKQVGMVCGTFTVENEK